MSAELAIPQPAAEIVQAGWWHEVAQPIIEQSEWDDLEKYSKELKAYIGIFEALGREDKIELTKAQRVVEKRRGELLGEPEAGFHGNQHVVVSHEQPPFHKTSVNKYRRIAQAWPVLEDHLLSATDTKEVSQRALLDIARQVLEDPEEPPKSNGTKIPREKRAKQIARLAEKGYTAHQISDKLDVSASTIQSIASEYDITLPRAGTQHRIDPNDVIENVVTGLEASAFALEQIDGMEDRIDPEQVEYWATSLDNSFRRLRKLRKTLKEVTREQ